jgi:arylsulfatase A-like enzyme
MTQKPTNIIVCLCDQLRAFELGCYGGGQVRSPNIDRLAADGVRFEHAVSNCPLCAPARSCLLSGQYTRSCTGKLGNIGDIEPGRYRLRQRTFPEVLKGAGFRTQLIGKWHVSPHPKVLGFDDSVRADVWHRNRGQTYYTQDDESFLVPGFGPEFESERVAEFLRSSQNQPFFLYYSISLPHMPFFDLPHRYLDAYRSEDVRLRENVEIDGELPYDRHWLLSYWYDHLYYLKHDPNYSVLPDGFDVRAATAAYFGAIQCVDDAVGRMMSALEETGQLENTLVVFLSDHGDNLGSHHFWNKERLIEESIRIPMLWHWPGGFAPRVCERQVASLIDVAPTLASLVGAGREEHFQGQDLVPLLTGDENALADNYAIVEAMRGEIGVRTPQFMYGIKTDGRSNRPGVEVLDDQFMFHNLEQDPYEMKNLAGSGVHSDVADELKAIALAFHENTPWLDIEPDSDDGELLSHD